VRLLIQPVTGVPSWFAYATLLLSITGIVSVLTNKAPDHPKAIDMDPSLFKTSIGFNLTAIAIILILTAIYSLLA
ncbi:MAG: sodium/glucose cotransporter, partial [Bacteroidota bacterium]